MDVDTGASKYDLYLELDERADEVLARFHYNTDLFDAASIVRMTRHWQQASSEPRQPEERLSELPILAPDERDQIWRSGTAPGVLTRKPAFMIVRVASRAFPDAIAVVFEDSQLTYRELNERANQLAGIC